MIIGLLESPCRRGYGVRLRIYRESLCLCTAPEPLKTTPQHGAATSLIDMWCVLEELRVKYRLRVTIFGFYLFFKRKLSRC